ncbi:MAG: cytochrome c biogenesis protein CcsA [Phycisphaerales bacterium]
MRLGGITQFAVGAAIAVFLAALVVGMVQMRAGKTGEGFAAQVDLTPLDRAAVQRQGRIKSFDSHASEMMGIVSGGRRVGGHRHDFTYLDMMFNAEAYDAIPCIRVKNPAMRRQIAQALDSEPIATPEQIEAFLDTGLIAPRLLNTRGVGQLMTAWSADLIRTAKFVNQIESALTVSQPQFLATNLRILPPPGASQDTPWMSVNDLFPDTATHPMSEALPEDIRLDLRRDWANLVNGWRAQDAGQVNRAIVSLSATAASLNPEVYPSRTKMLWESIYFKLGHLTWLWIPYMFTMAFLLMSIAFRWDGARSIGLGMFSASLVMQTIAIAWRWWISGRWPNSNMFEAVTTSVWFGAVLALVLEFVARKTPLRNFFALAAAAACGTALMAAEYSPYLDANISNMMPVLHDLWLYIHTNVIIASYALIFMASVTALIYVVARAFGAPADYARQSGTAMLLDEAAGVPGKKRRSRSLTELLDGATLVLMELSFVMLWAGLVMGAIWADHSWGRPWGWDPKEVFALNTFIVFLVLIHVRLKTRDKGLWTALLAIIGCGVMLFNWIVINFVISGLHSYA